MNPLCQPYTSFKHVQNISDDFLLNILEANMKTFLDWAFLCVGGWFDAEINKETIHGINKHSQLVPVADPDYTDGQVWQSIRKDWVWEKGVSFNGTQPIEISIVSVNGTVIPNDKSQYFVNYPQGQIVFNTPQPIDAIIQVEHSYRHIQTYRASDSPWFNYLQTNTFNTSNPDITRLEDGDWSIAGNHRVQLPAIIIESVPRSRSYPYELGNNDIVIEQDIAFYVLAENKNDRNKILDILRLQQDLTFILYDTNEVSQNDAFPLDHNGDLKTYISLMYPGLVDTYPWRKSFIKNMSLFEIDSVAPEFHRGMARATIEIIS